MSLAWRLRSAAAAKGVKPAAAAWPLNREAEHAGVIDSSLVWVAEDLPGLVESGHGALVSAEVRVMQAGKAAIRGLNRGTVGVGPDGEQVVVVMHRH